MKALTNKEYLIKIYERVDNMIDDMKEIKQKVEKNSDEIIKIKVKVVSIASIVSFIISLLFLALKKFF